MSLSDEMQAFATDLADGESWRDTFPPDWTEEQKAGFERWKERRNREDSAGAEYREWAWLERCMDWPLEVTVDDETGQWTEIRPLPRERWDVD